MIYSKLLNYELRQLDNNYYKLKKIKKMESLKGLELATLLCIGLAGFIIFVMIGGSAKKNNNVYFTLCGLFALLALCSMTYNSFFVNWAYIEGNFTWNIIATILVTIGICAVFFGILYIWMTISEYLKYQNKAKSAKMSVKDFKAWKENTIKTLADGIRANGEEPRYHTLLKLYDAEEQRLFSAK